MGTRPLGRAQEPWVAEGALGLALLSRNTNPAWAEEHELGFRAMESHIAVHVPSQQHQPWLGMCAGVAECPWGLQGALGDVFIHDALTLMERCPVTHYRTGELWSVKYPILNCTAGAVSLYLFSENQGAPNGLEIFKSFCLKDRVSEIFCCSPTTMVITQHIKARDIKHTISHNVFLWSRTQDVNSALPHHCQWSVDFN